MIWRDDPEVWAEGYSQAELDDAQARFGLTFPPDLVELLRERRLRLGYDWRNDDVAIRRMLAWPLEGLLFHVEHEVIWWSEWGPRPSTPGERAEVVGAVVAVASKLIPLYAHRFLAGEPVERGNPVFSIHSTDVVYYGIDLEDYILHEFYEHKPRLSGTPRHIPFWSDLVDWDGLPPEQQSAAS
ncbi:MAG: hypothetical protein QOI38_3097 [Sphingomonadales bacterium]|jgi:hypothetical protein|nr:hypothetical protein [Sphingomonadales bacterium]